VHELCTLLELPTPDPAREDTRDNAYVFERRITFHHGDGTESLGFIDWYPAGAIGRQGRLADVVALQRRIAGPG
jgi:hypothetical protein